MAKEEEIKVRVPRVLKDAVVKLAGDRFTSESEITRQAIIEYLHKHRPELLAETAAPAAPPPEPAPGPVNYRAKRTVASSASKKDITAQLTDKLKADFQKSKPPGAPPKS